MNSAWLLILGISLANNLDNTGVGIAYGVARIRISALVNLWISIITVAITGGAVYCGGALARFLPGHMPNILSAAILCAIGLWVMLPTILHAQRFKQPVSPSPERAGSRFSLLNILDDPRKADRDNSRHIDFFEASLLGIALSINNIGGGISAGLLHLSAVSTALLSAAISFVVIALGGLLSRRTADTRLSHFAPVVSGILLIAIGLYELR